MHNEKCITTIFFVRIKNKSAAEDSLMLRVYFRGTFKFIMRMLSVLNYVREIDNVVL